MNDLVREGPIVLAQLGVDPSRQQVFDEHGHLPGRQPVRLMIDTGAEISLIHETIAMALGLRWIGDQMITGISQKPELHRKYAATLHLPVEHPAPRIITIPLIVAGMRENVSRSPFDGLLGRRFLHDFELAYSGPEHTFAIRTDRPFGG